MSDKEKNPLWDTVVEYLSHLEFERRLSENTISAYKHDIIRFLFHQLNIQIIIKKSGISG